MNDIINCWKNYFKFNGKTGIFEFWKWMLFVGGISLIFLCPLTVIVSIWGNQIPPSRAYEMVCMILLSAMMLFCFSAFIPTLAVMSRRLRDAGICPWWLLVPAGLSVISFVVFMDAALAGMSEFQPSTPLAIRAVTYAVTALTVFIFICLFCRKSAK